MIDGTCAHRLGRDAVPAPPSIVAPPSPSIARRLAAALRLPLWHKAQALTQRAAIEAHPLWHSPPLDAAGLPVLLVGGMGSTPSLLRPLRDLLHRLNCRVDVPSVRYGVGCGEHTTRAVEHALARLVETTGEPAVLIGHSRGGQFARTLAVRRPDLLRGLITLGSPTTGATSTTTASSTPAPTT